MHRTQANWIAAAIVIAAGLAAHAIRASEPGDPGPLGLAGARMSAPDSAAARDDLLDVDFQRSLRAREILYRTYAPESDAPVWVFLAYFDRQREGSQVHSPRHCYPGAGWSIEREMSMPVTWREGNARGLVVSDGVERRLVCYWYQTPSESTHDVLHLKLALTRRAVLRGTQDVVFGNVSTRIDADPASAFERIAPYLRDAENEVSRLYRERNERRARSH